MVPASSYENILTRLDHRGREGAWMCGLLFAPPSTPIGRSIVERLDDWHHRSGDNIDFFCIGYIEYDDVGDGDPVGRITGREGAEPVAFYYSARAFNEIREWVSNESGWRYSGEADLLLVNAVTVSRPPVTREYRPRTRLAMEEVLALDVDRIVRDGVFSSASRVLESVCRVADRAAEHGEIANVYDYSDRQFARTLFRGALRTVAQKLKLDAPLGARHFLVGAHLLEG